MNELDNQIEDNDSDYDLLAIDTETADDTTDAEDVDISEAETEEVEEVEAKEIEEVVEATADPIESLEDLEVKYLHDVKKLKDIPKDELKTLVQKGMNHDRLVDKIEGYKALESKFADFEELATFYNMDVDSMKEALYQQWYETKAEQDGLTPEIVKREHQLGKKEKATLQGDKEAQRQTKMMQAFVGKYPNVDETSIKPETWEKVKDGADITQAYEQQLKDDEVSTLRTKIQELETKLKTNTQNTEVKKKAVVKSTTANGSDDPDKNDDFLQGLFGK